MRRAPARVSPLRSAAPLRVWAGASAPKLRNTASPRANDCTKASPGRLAPGAAGSDMRGLSTLAAAARLALPDLQAGTARQDGRSRVSKITQRRASRARQVTLGNAD